MPTDAASIASELVLGRYRMLEERGKGGFGTVSICWDPRLMRRVAIKTIPLRMARPEHAAPKHRHDKPMAGRQGASSTEGVPEEPAADAVEHDLLLRAALAETRTASMLAHPNIVSMLDFESDAENAYIIMEYVEGASLAELLDSTENGLLNADEAACVVESVCDALQFAHDNGVLHLDIKPDNILVDMSGRVKLADFGMAALSSVTGYAGARGGTVGYMPPEQIECAGVDVRTDVFALASVVYEALTGFRPFAANSLNASLDLVRQGAPDPCALNESVEPQAADALLAALEPDPAARPVSAEAFAGEIMGGLGRPKAGRKDLAAFVADVRDDSEPCEEDSEEVDGAPYAECADDCDLGPFSRSFPRLARIALRGLAGYSSGAAALAGIAACMGNPAADLAALAAGLVVGALGCAAPQLGYALAVAALVAGSAAAGAWAFAAALLALGAAWWLVVGRTEPLASSGTFAGALGGAGFFPLSALLCGWLLPPGKAALGALTGFAGCAAVAVVSSGASAAPALSVQMAASPAFWLSAAAWAGAAATMGACCHNASKTRCYLGCLLAGLVLVALKLVTGRMENGGSWPALSDEVAVYAIGSTILIGLCVFMFGSPYALAQNGLMANGGSEATREDASS